MTPAARTPNYGQRLRIGMLIPSVNTVVEPQMQALMPAGVSLHVTRLRLAGSSEEQLRAMVSNVEEGAALLADAGVDLIAFHCTAVSMLSRAFMKSISGRIHAATGVPATTTGHGVLLACEALQIQRLSFVTPYREETHRRELDFVRECGMTVVSDGFMGVTTQHDYAKKTPEELLEFAKLHASPQAQAFFFGCTAVRSSEIIDQLEEALGMPVLTSNQVMAWHALRSGGIADQVAGYGELLRCF